MTVKLIMRDKVFIAKGGMTLRDCLLSAGVNPESVLALRQGQMITDDEILQDGEEIRLVAVISGGAQAGTRGQRTGKD